MAHLKRLAAPRSWLIGRKKGVFVSKPKPGPHALEASLPLGMILRDSLKLGRTMREVKKLLNNQTVLVDGKRRKDHRFPVGLFDVLAFPELKENFRLLLDRKGRLALKKIEAKESSLKPGKIRGKTRLAKKIQLNLHDGRNLLVEPDFKGKVGDTVLIELPGQKVKGILELKEGAFVFLVRGKGKGDAGVLQEIKGERAIYQRDNQKIETLKKYLFVLGKQKPVIDIKLEKEGDIGRERESKGEDKEGKGRDKESKREDKENK